MRLIIIRHGETIDNVRDIIQGQRHGKLTERGKEQVRKLALRLKDEKIDVIFSSDLGRARETTEEVAKFHKVPIYYTPELRERSFGIFEGRPMEEARKAIRESGLSKIEFKPEGGESLIDLRKRAQRFLDKILKEYDDETILISSHSNFNKMLLGALLGISIEESLKIKQDNACLNIIEISNPLNCKVHVINSTEHLKDC
ncbi:MAG: histidine phosphatase family protein [Candidatus Asgardarchaeia archaeon]